MYVYSITCVFSSFVLVSSQQVDRSPISLRRRMRVVTRNLAGAEIRRTSPGTIPIIEARERARQ
jgi:hypothetical protein